MAGHKRIIICCDGTWQSATSGKENVPSNVTQLARILDPTWTDEDGNECPQIVWYDSGIGTTSSWLGQRIEGAFGNGLEVKVIEAYQFCVLNYSPGDKIMCFGFSRGAYTARSVAGLISDVGICPRDKLQSFHELWEFYKWKGSKKNEEEGEEEEERVFKDADWIDFVHGIEADPADQIAPEMIQDLYADPTVYVLKPHSEWLTDEGKSWPREVEVVGVYDTVGALGFPKIFNYRLPFGPDENGFHNVQLSPHIKHAFQALALDEHRGPFSPTLWHLPPVPAAVPENELAGLYARVDAGHRQWRESRKDPTASRGDRKRLDLQWRQDLSRFYKLEEANLPQPELIQVWFPGCHVNIGGGSSDTLKEEGDLEALSHLAFAWMLDQISPYVSINRRLYQEETESHYRGIKQLNVNAETAAQKVREHEAEIAQRGGWAQFNASSIHYVKKVFHPFTAAPSNTAKVHQLTWGLGDFSDSYDVLFALSGSERRTPGNYPSGPNIQLSRTNEYIHPSVGYRMQKTRDDEDPKKRYGPYQWKEGQFVRQPQGNGPKYEYVITGSAQPVDEWELPVSSETGQTLGFNYIPYERYVVFDNDAKEYVRRLDEGYGHTPQPMGNFSIEDERRSYVQD